MQDAPKAVWSILYVSAAFFFSSLKYNFIAYRSSKVTDCIFEIHQLWRSGFSRVYSNCCCSCSFEPEILKIGQSSHKMYTNNILNFQESTPILNACTKKSGNLVNAPPFCCFIIFSSAMSLIVLDQLENLTRVWKCVEIELLSESYLNNFGRFSFVICLHTKDLLPHHPKRDFPIFGQ